MKPNDELGIDEVVGIIFSIDNANKRLREEIKYVKAHSANIDRFYAKTLTVEMVAYLHDVHPNTVRKYINCGLIEKHPNSSPGKMLIRASEALTLDFDELRRRHKKLIYNAL